MAEELGARLIRAGLATREQLADALADPEPALAARLVDRGVDEEELVGFFVSQGFGPAATAQDLAGAKDHAHLLSADLAYAMQAVALSSSDGLRIAMSDPTDAHAKREIERTAGCDVHARVASVSAIRRALSDAYPGSAPIRRQTSETPLSLVRPKSLSETSIREQALREDTAAFPLLRPKKKPKKEQKQRSAPQVEVDSATKPQAEPPATSPGTPDPAPSKKLFKKPVSRSAPPDRLEARAKSIIPPAAASWDDLPSPKKDESPPPSADLGPILAAIRRSEDRDEIVRLGCEGALTVGRSAVFLALRRGVLRGWEAKGAGVSADAIRNLWIPSTSPSMFRSVVADHQPYRGPYGASAADNLYRAATGSRGGRIEIHAICVAGRTVAVLCVDDLRDGGAERVEHLAHLVGRALESLISRK